MKNTFSLLRGEPLYRLQQALGFNPDHQYAALVRAAVVALLCWAPLAIWACIHTGSGSDPDSFLRHFGIHVRFLLAVPILILSAQGADRGLTRVLKELTVSGAVRPHEVERFQTILNNNFNLFSSRIPWITIVVAVIFFNSFRGGEKIFDHELIWTIRPGAESPGESLSFALWWFLYVSSPLFTLIICAWLWALFVIVLMLFQISGLDLDLVATHPDGFAGLGYLKRLPSLLFGFALSVSAVLCARWAHDIYYHDADLGFFIVPYLTWMVFLFILQILPLLAVSLRVWSSRREALLRYGALVSEHGRLIRDIWIDTKSGGSRREILDAPELGPLVDVNSIYSAVKETKTIPLDKDMLKALLIPVLIPFLPLVLIQVPLRDLITGLLKILA